MPQMQTSMLATEPSLLAQAGAVVTTESAEVTMKARPAMRLHELLEASQ